MLRNNVGPMAVSEAFMASSVRCKLCNEPMMLENARIDESGKAVHEDCYLKTLQITRPMVEPTDRAKKPGSVA